MQDVDEDAAENGEAEKLNDTKECDEPKTRDQGTSMSQERLSLMIKYNQIGSLTSLPRGSRVSIRWTTFALSVQKIERKALT